MNVTVMNSLVYEVLLSMSLYKRQTHLKYLTISKDWHKAIREKISDALHHDIMGLEDLKFEDLSVLLIKQSPFKNDFEDYIKWLSELSIGSLYEMLAPYENAKNPLPTDLEDKRIQHISLMTRWYQEYFIAKLDEIDIKVNVDKRRLRDTPSEEIERLSKGFVVENLDASEVVLVPSWHIRPLSLIDQFNKKVFITYPCSLSLEEETLLITKALSEQKRLEMCRLMKDEEKSFTELVQLMGMTKGNIHHHLLLLRSAGLLKIIPKQDHFTYQFRKSRITDLLNYLTE